jgi:hypothetical protein
LLFPKTITRVDGFLKLISVAFQFVIRAASWIFVGIFNLLTSLKISIEVLSLVLASLREEKEEEKE